MNKKEAKNARQSEPAEPPVWFLVPKSFYLKLARFAKEFNISQDKYLKNAIDFYAVEMRRQNKPLTKALGNVELSAEFRKMVGTASKTWWSKLSEEEKAARAKKASDARWKKAKTKAAAGSE